jgi:signal transduction histidine kinase
MVIFRIAQEALNNIIKYSGAGEAGISLEKADGRLTLEVRDNGQGFQVGAVLNKIGPERGSGLAGMKERTELAGGTFSVASAPTRGTVIRAVWSVTSSEEPPPV